MKNNIRDELVLYGDLIGFTSAFMAYDSGDIDSKIKLKTLVSLEEIIVIVEAAKKKRDFRFLYIGSAIQGAFILDISKKTFGDIKREHAHKFFWPEMKRCLDCFVRAHRDNEIVLSGHELELVVGEPLVYKRLTLPVRRKHGTPLVFSAFLLNNRNVSKEAPSCHSSQPPIPLL